PIFVAEGAPIPITQGATSHAIVGPTRKLAFGVAVSRELDESTPEGAAAVLGRMLAESAAKSLDTYVFDNVAGDPTRPAGLLNGVTPLVSTVAGSGISAAAGDISKIAGAMADAAVNPESLILIAHPVEAWNLLMLRGFERLVPPVLQSPAIPRGTVIGVVPEAIASGYDGDPQVEVSKQATDFEDTTPLAIGTPGSPPTVAAPTRSLLQQELTGVKVRMRCAWASLQPGAAQFLQSVNW